MRYQVHSSNFLLQEKGPHFHFMQYISSQLLLALEECAPFPKKALRYVNLINIYGYK